MPLHSNTEMDKLQIQKVCVDSETYGQSTSQGAPQNTKFDLGQTNSSKENKKYLLISRVN